MALVKKKIMYNEKIPKKTIGKDILKEIAGWTLNKHLILEEQEDYSIKATKFRLEFKPYNPNKTSLFKQWFLSDLEKIQAEHSNLIEIEMLKTAIEDMIEKSLNDMNTVHHLERSFWKRLKYLFIKKL